MCNVTLNSRSLASTQEMSQQMAEAIEVGTANVYADLGYVDPEAMQLKSSLVAEIIRRIDAERLHQKAASELLGIAQADLTKMVRGQFRYVSESSLLELVSKFERAVNQK